MRRAQAPLAAPLSAALLALAAPVLAQQAAPPPPPPHPTDARPQSTGRVPQGVLDDFIAGFNGDDAAFDRAMTGAERIIAADPHNAEALAWRSSGMGMRAGKAFGKGDIPLGMRSWQESIRGLNRAVDLEPGNIQVRFVRGKSMLESSLHDPNPATSGEAARTAIGDLELALSSFEDLEKQLPKQTREEFYAWLLQASEKVGDKERAEKYRALAGEKAAAAEARVDTSAQSSIPGETVRAALAIVDSEIATMVKDDLRASLSVPERLKQVLIVVDAHRVAPRGDPAATAWRGFARSLRAGPLFAQGKFEEGVRVWDDASAELSKGVTAGPTLAEPLILRALTRIERARHDPDPAARAESARGAVQDIERAQRMIADGGKPLGVDAGAELWASLGAAHRLTGDTARAKAALGAGLKLNPSEAVAKRLRSSLEKMQAAR
ncbi:MAG: hypothetical protein WD749_14520 [Phycisphaerales bacterium]